MNRFQKIIKSLRKFAFILISLFIGGLIGYGINQSFKVSEYRQLNLLLGDIQDYIREMHLITNLSGEGLLLAGQACKLECATSIACYSTALEKAGNLDGQLKVHRGNSETLLKRINDRYQNIWLQDFVRIDLEPPKVN